MRSASAQEFSISCYNCKASFDAGQSTFCSCITRTRTLVCPNCLHCFCAAPASYIRGFWADAPDDIWQRRDASRAAAPSTEGEVDAGRPLVLIVDDDRDVQMVAMHAVSSLGYEVASASDGEEALAQVRKRKPDLILTDALLPRLDGRELCRMLKNDPETSSITVVIMSAVYKAGRYRSEALRDFRADEFVVKPLEVSVLRETLSRFL